MKRCIKAADRGDALVGIYWYTDDGKVIGVVQPVDEGEMDGPYLQYSGGNHMTLWRQVVKDCFLKEIQQEVINKGFKSLYRGRCIYFTMTQTYTVTCSEDLVNDNEFRSKIREFFQLENVRVEFEPLMHYKYKTELTGNPAVDEHYFD